MGHTEKELLDIQRIQSYFIDTRNNDWDKSIDALNHQLPCMYHLNSKKDISLVYMNDRASDFFRLSIDCMNKGGGNLLLELMDPNDHKIIPQLISFYNSNDENAVFSFFQRVKRSPKEDYEWLFTTTKIYKEKNTLISITSRISQLDSIGHKMSRILDENTFMKRNFKKFMGLTKREREIMILLALGHSCPRISEMLFISVHTVERHKKNIYRKLEIKNIVELIKYAQAFDLI